MATSSFLKFPKLPAELRLKIWEEALPELIEQPLYFYSQRKTTHAYDTPEDDSSLAAVVPQNIDVQHGQVRPRTVELPHLFVNWEARGTALCWVDKQDAEKLASWMRPKQSPYHHHHHHHHILVRPFCPETDTLYVPAELWDEFILEKRKTESVPGYREVGGVVAQEPVFITFPAPERALRSVAVPMRLLQEHPGSLVGAFFRWRGVKVVYLVVHGREDDERQFESDAMEGKQPWRFEVSGATLKGTWVPANREMEWEASGSSNNNNNQENDPDLEELSTVMLGTQPSLTALFREWNSSVHRDFRVQLIRVVRQRT
ncbi:hypothetical protein ASPACDRAFT_45224 [Aspergillus aculeatus ATCC 16872]|uniref:2EXR domain-containing protein n=1 Tax=Aspergillus aculeatus (strain ATCC 16872 / CBS 172.66 / WB 5094) TaxID=690307 RepID=A0A1L9WP22_ASPA1|nr:uncharacterized protein ASPACDRAFT_45224 [Aspergillus aculeatus ATCC 16872]OJJ97925.1 hypothetical protein ASPACDRAFT_45224 [Aspergillus aculeatus ATCC 16872]